MKLALLNASTIPPVDMGTMASALSLYLNRDVCPAWERAPIEVEFMRGLSIAPDGWTPLVVFDTPDQPQCLGYHDIDAQGRAYGRAFYSMVPSGRVLRDSSGAGASLAGVLSHEAAEMALDVLANAYQDGPFIDPVTKHSYGQVAVELCDPVQETAYAITVAGAGEVDASNFILPSWFNARGGVGPVDFMGLLKGPLTMAPGGYVIVRDLGTESRVFGFLGRPKPPSVKKIISRQPPAAWREAMKLLPGGRTARRLGT